MFTLERVYPLGDGAYLYRRVRQYQNWAEAVGQLAGAAKSNMIPEGEGLAVCNENGSVIMQYPEGL